MDGRCGDCKFWQSDYEVEDEPALSVGFCRRYPPQIDPVFAGKCEDNDQFGAEADPDCWQQPLTYAYQVCGEFCQFVFK
jgi:hypothetical protein